MSHKYEHIKNLKQLDEELNIALIRRDLLINEITSNVDDLKSSFSLGGVVMSLIGGALSFGSPSKTNSGSAGSDKWENIIGIATKLGGLIALLRAFRGRKKN